MVVGSRFGLGLAWMVLVGVVGICVCAQTSGRVAAVGGRATFKIVRERLVPLAGLANLAASILINLLTRIFGGRPPTRLGVSGESLDATWVERWVSDHIIGRIPGGRHAPQ